jgi:hypothetical protein
MNTPEGWYPDAQDQTKLRYWNGTRWTDYTAPAEVKGQPSQLGAVSAAGTPEPSPSQVTDAATVPARVPLHRRGWVLPSAAGLALIVGIAIGALLW